MSDSPKSKENGQAERTLDERDQAIVDERMAALDAVAGPRVGDFVVFADGVQRRVSYIWPAGDHFPGSAQTSDGGSFYLDRLGLSFSGSLHPGVSVETLTDTGETRDGAAWIFHHDSHRAHNGVEFKAPFRVFRCSLPADEAERAFAQVINGERKAEPVVVEPRDHALNQIQTIAYDGDLMADSRLPLERIPRLELFDYVKALEAKLGRIVNIAEAGEPDEDWPPAKEAFDAPDESVSGEQLIAEREAGDPDHCPKCGSGDICQNTLNAAEDGDWACLDCDAKFFADDPSEVDGPRVGARAQRHAAALRRLRKWIEDPETDGDDALDVIVRVLRDAGVMPAPLTDAARAEEAMRQPEGEPFIVVGIFPVSEGMDGNPERFAEEYGSATGWEGAEAAAKEEHPALVVAAVLKVEDGKVRVCGEKAS